MRLLSNIKIATVAIAVISTVGTSLIGYWSVRAVLNQSLKERVKTLATVAAAGVDPVALATIRDAPSIDSPQYAKLEVFVRSVTQANQGGSFPIRFAYLLVPTVHGATSGWDVAVDSDPRTSVDWTPPGTPYNPLSSGGKQAQVLPLTSSDFFMKDEWGEWLSGFAPIRSTDGSVVGLVGVDIPYLKILHAIDVFFWIAIGLSGVVSVMVYVAASTSINRLMGPVKKILDFIHAVGDGDFSQRLDMHARDEVAVVAGELNQMAGKLGERERLARENIALVKNITRKQEQLTAIAEVDVQLNEIQDIDILMERILADARRLTACDAGSVMLREGDDLHLTYVQNDTLNRNLPVGKRFSVKSTLIPVGGGSISGYAALKGQTVVIDDAYEIPPESPFHFNRAVDDASGYRTRAVLAVPLRTSAGKNVGVLQLLNPIGVSGEPRSGFSPDDLEVIQHFSSAATVALERASLTRSIVMRMIKMAELRDPSETGAHVNRVAAYSVILYEGWARRHQYDAARIQRERDVLRIAAMLHDVGKVGIPDAILKKPGRLTVDEYAVMQQHSEIGARLFADRDSVLDRSALEVALHHHERWDGTGYPGAISLEGDQTQSPNFQIASIPIMKGESIPIFARIVSVADVFDALSSKRQYKEAWPEDRVINEMQINAGRQFDPELIEVLIEHLDEIREAAARYETVASDR